MHNVPDGVPPDVWHSIPGEMQMVAQDMNNQGVPLDTSIAAAGMLTLAIADTLTITPDDLVPIFGWIDEAALWSASGFLASRAVQGQSLDQAVMELLP